MAYGDKKAGAAKVISVKYKKKKPGAEKSPKLTIVDKSGTYDDVDKYSSEDNKKHIYKDVDASSGMSMTVGPVQKMDAKSKKKGLREALKKLGK